MKANTVLALQRIRELTAEDWSEVARSAHAAQVGGWRWEEAWVAAAGGHPAAQAVLELSRRRGVASGAAAALAGALAAIEAEDALTPAEFGVLVAPADGLLSGLTPAGRPSPAPAPACV